MSLDRRAVSFLLAAHRLGADFETTLSLGRQGLLVDNLAAAFAASGTTLKAPERYDDAYADGLLRHIGARRLDTIDASEVEGATIVHDLNEPLPEELKGRYSLVLDAGTLEHVFEYPRALRSSLEAVRVGGHFITIAPTNNWWGHGFYQLSPELFYRVLCEANGFRVRCILARSLAGARRFYRVPDPQELGRRLQLLSFGPMQLYVLAERTADLPIGAPQQSDYETYWSGGEQPMTVSAGRFKRFIPRRLRDTLREAYWLSDLPREFLLTEPALEPVSLKDL